MLAKLVIARYPEGVTPMLVALEGGRISRLGMGVGHTDFHTRNVSCPMGRWHERVNMTEMNLSPYSLTTFNQLLCSSCVLL